MHTAINIQMLHDILSLLFMIAYAATKDFSSFSGFVNYITGLIQGYVIPILLTLALLCFIYGVIVFIAGKSNDERRKNFLRTIVWALVALFIMLAIVGIVNFFANSFGFGDVTFIPRLQHVTPLK